MDYNALQIFGSGAASDGAVQTDSTHNLGGYRSASEVSRFGVIGGMKSVTIQRVSEAHFSGQGVLESDGADSFRWTAPQSSTPGSWVNVPLSTPTVLADGDNATRFVRVYRTSSVAVGSRALRIVDTYNGVLGWENVPHVDRIAGQSKYGCLMIKNAGSITLNLNIYLAQFGLQKVLGTGGYSASGSVSISLDNGNFKSWPASGYVGNGVTGEVLYYTYRTDTTLSVGASGRDVFGTLSGGAAGAGGDKLYSVPGMSIATETPSSHSSGYVQTIANDHTSPSGLTWKTPLCNTDINVIPVTLAAGEIVGLWLRRKIVAGAVSVACVENAVSIEIV